MVTSTIVWDVWADSIMGNVGQHFMTMHVRVIRAGHK